MSDFSTPAAGLPFHGFSEPGGRGAPAYTFGRMAARIEGLELLES